MARIDDYQQALELVKKELSGKNPDLVAGFSGAEVHKAGDGKTALLLNFLNQDITISWPDLVATNNRSKEELSIQQQILLLHYLQGAWSSNGPTIKGEWIAFQDIPDGRFYLDAFSKRAKVPLIQAFGAEPKKLLDIAARIYSADRLDLGDFSVVVKALPLVPLALIIWEGDEEFPAEGNVLFDQSISKIVSAEDVAWLAGMVVYPLIGMATKKG